MGGPEETRGVCGILRWQHEVPALQAVSGTEHNFGHAACYRLEEVTAQVGNTDCDIRIAKQK